MVYLFFYGIFNFHVQSNYYFVLWQVGLHPRKRMANEQRLQSTENMTHAYN